MTYSCAVLVLSLFALIVVQAPALAQEDGAAKKPMPIRQVVVVYKPFTPAADSFLAACRAATLLYDILEPQR